MRSEEINGQIKGGSDEHQTLSDLAHDVQQLVVAARASSWGLAQQNSEAAEIQPSNLPATTDGQHDFDFEFGTWKIHLKRLEQRLAGSTTWIEFEGTSVTRKVWNGRSQLEQFETDSPGGGHIEGLTLRLYNPQSHQWRLYWANSKIGILDPPQVGEFKNGRG